jgi:hypothetical protein
LYAPIGGRKYPELEAWTLLGMLMPTTITPHVTRTWQVEGGWGAHAEARTLDGTIVSAADAYCMRDEEKWENKPGHQLASMASTRACSRAMRLPLSFVMSLTGYEVTPAEEMEAAARGETVTGGKGVRPGWRDIGEQQRAHADLGELIDAHDLRQWVVEWCDSKGYVRPLAKGQFNQLRRAIERELSDRAADPSDPGASPPSSGSDPTSEGSSAPTATGPGMATAGSPSDDQSPTPAPPPTTAEGEGGPRPDAPASLGASGRRAGRRARQDSAAPAGPERDEAAEQAAFEQQQADDDPGRWTR